MPTPNTNELPRVVTSVADGAPDDPLALAVAPIAPDPFVPVVSTFENVATVIDDKVARTRPACPSREARRDRAGVVVAAELDQLLALGVVVVDDVAILFLGLHAKCHAGGLVTRAQLG